MKKTRQTIPVSISLSLLFVLIVGLLGCSQQPQQSSGSQYADEEVIAVMGDTLEKRFDAADKTPGRSSEKCMEISRIEIDALSPYRSREFEDSKLQESILSYINLIEDM